MILTRLIFDELVYTCPVNLAKSHILYLLFTQLEKSQKQMVEANSSMKPSNEQIEPNTPEESNTTISTTTDVTNDQHNATETSALNPIDLLPSLYSDLS